MVGQGLGSTWTEMLWRSLICQHRFCTKAPMSTLAAQLRPVHSSEVAVHVFAQHDVRNLCKRGQLVEALEALERLCRQGVEVGDDAFCSLLEECHREKNLEIGRQAHALVVRYGCCLSAPLKNNLIRMFAACGSITEARQVFFAIAAPDVYAWHAIISAHVACGCKEQALILYSKMTFSSIKPNNYVHVTVIKACTNTALIVQGRLVHSHILQLSKDTSLHVGSVLVDMYAKCGFVDDARAMFDNLPARDSVLWNTMIAGYAQHGLDKEALLLFEKMQAEEIAPDSVTFANVVKVCGSITFIVQGLDVHSLIIKTGFKMNTFVGNTLINMYAKCGLLPEAKKVFDKLPERDVVSWTALMNAYGHTNNWTMAINCFEELRRHGVRPDGATFRCLLTACSHAGLVKEGQHYFQMMIGHFRIMPTEEDIICVADLLARGGKLFDAEKLLLTVPSNNDVGWTSLLTACKSHGEVELGRRCLDHAVKINPSYGSCYVLMSSIYADAQMWEHVQGIEELRKQSIVEKNPGKASIEINHKAEEFIGGDKTHHQCHEIHSKLKVLSLKLKMVGYHPLLNVVTEAL